MIADLSAVERRFKDATELANNAGECESARPCFQFPSRWPSSAGGGLQNRKGWCDSSTGFHFVAIVSVN